MTKLHFTRVQPTEPGTYLAMVADGVIRRVEVYSYSRNGGEWVVEWGGIKESIRNLDWLWCGPLEIEADR